jgi:transcriptional regulator with XRE-family HTH domain
MELRQSQTQLAANAGKLSASDISRFENGYGRPYPAQAVRLGQALNLKPEELLERAELRRQSMKKDRRS